MLPVIDPPDTVTAPTVLLKEPMLRVPPATVSVPLVGSALLAPRLSVPALMVVPPL